MPLKEISYQQLQLNPMTLIGQEWMLLTAGSEERGYNTMTASWGHLGSLWGPGWGMPTSVVYVRPQRYTKQFMDRESSYTLSFFPPEYQNKLAYLGCHSGRDEDKVAKTGLTPIFDGDTTYFAEAKLVLVCRKVYQAPIVEEGFVDKSVINDWYPERDYHDLYIGEIIKLLSSEE